MNSGKVLRTLIGLGVLVLLIILSLKVVVEPWAARKIIRELNKNKSFTVEIEGVHFQILHPGLELEGITLVSKSNPAPGNGLNGEIALVKIKGINLRWLLFNDSLIISKVLISDAHFSGELPPSQKEKKPVITPSSLAIGTISFEKIYLDLKSSSTKQTYYLKNGNVEVLGFEIHKKDTLTYTLLKQYEFGAEEIGSVAADSLNTYTVSGISYSTTTQNLAVDTLAIHPNFSDYRFTAHFPYQKGRIEAGFDQVVVHNIDMTALMRSKTLISNYIEIGKMNISAFRDQRKEFRHVKKPIFQELIYSWPGYLRIDSIRLAEGFVRATNHAPKANEAGIIEFTDINALITGITNDTLFKTEKAYINLEANGMVMGKGKLAILMKARTFDSQNTFTLTGNLSGMEAYRLNPILEKNAFIYVNTGKIDAMNFQFTANDQKATGTMTLLYHDLDLTLKNKKTDDTTAIVEKVVSFIINKSMYSSNPMPGKAVRVGIINYERDPERFIFGYWFKSILSGMKTSLLKNQPDRKGKKKQA